MHYWKQKKRPSQAQTKTVTASAPTHLPATHWCRVQAPTASPYKGNKSLLLFLWELSINHKADGQQYANKQAQ